jgi:hypothetical protein
LVGFFVDPLRNTFLNAIRIHGVALAGFHVSQTRIVAVLIIATFAVLECDASRHDFAGARFNRARRFHAGAGFNRAGGFHARAGFNRAGRFHARAGFNRAGRFHTGAGFDRAGGNRFVTASGFNPPPLIRCSVADVLRNTAFCNASRIHGVAYAIGHFIKAGVVAILIVIAITVHKLDALGFDDFAGARFDDFARARFDDFARAGFDDFAGAGFDDFAGARFDDFARAGFDNFAGAGFNNFAGAGFNNFAGAGFDNFAGAGFDNFAGARYRFYTGTGNICEARRFAPPGLVRYICVTANSRRAFISLALDHSIARSLNHVRQTGLIAVLTNTVLDTAEINAEFNRGFAGAGFNNFAGARFDNFAGAGFDNFAGARFDNFARAGFDNFAGAGFNNFAGAGFNNFAGAGFDNFARAGFDRAGGNRFVTASGFNPPPLIRCSVADVLRNTAFSNASRIHGVAYAIGHFIKARVVAILVVIAITIHELDALGFDNFARARNRSHRARGFFAGAGNRSLRAGGFFAGAGNRCNRAGGFFAGARNRCLRAGGFFARARNRCNTRARSRFFDAFRFAPPPCLVRFFVNPLRDPFLDAILVHGIALACGHLS